MGDARATEPLITALKDTDEQTRYAAASALGQIGYARAIAPLLTAALRDLDPAIWEHFAASLAKHKRKTYAEITLTEADELPLRKVLTPVYLSDKLSPYLKAIADIQNIINEIKGQKPQEIVVKEITQESPISVSLEGAAEAVQVVKDTVVPWRRKHAEIMAHLLEQEKRADIESKKAEVLERRASAAKGRAEADKLAAEAVRQREEAEKMKLENEKSRLELHRAKIQLALDILRQFAPNLPETERISYLIKLLSPLDVVISSKLEIAADTENTG